MIRTGKTIGLLLAGGALMLVPSLIKAQGGRGRGPAGPPPTGKAQAPIDLTGYWVSEIVDEWRFRVSPMKGDIVYMPLNAEARRVAMAWDPDKDLASGQQCKAYGAIGVMQRPGRLHITWQDDNTLKIETDAGKQTRLIHFGPAPEKLPPASLQGYSAAQWQGPGYGRGRGGAFGTGPASGPKNGNLHIVTTDMTPGYVRKNGVPYSEKALQIEDLNVLTGQLNDIYMVDTARVEDPVYLTGEFVRSYQFKKLPDATGWDPEACLPR